MESMVPSPDTHASQSQYELSAHKARRVDPIPVYSTVPGTPFLEEHCLPY